MKYKKDDKAIQTGKITIFMSIFIMLLMAFDIFIGSKNITIDIVIICLAVIELFVGLYFMFPKYPIYVDEEKIIISRLFFPKKTVLFTEIIKHDLIVIKKQTAIKLVLNNKKVFYLTNIEKAAEVNSKIRCKKESL